MTISRHTSRLEVGGVSLNPVDLAFTVHETRTPYASLTATCALSDAAALLDPTQPERRVQFSMRQDFGTGEPISQISADYAGKTARELSAKTEVQNLNPSFEDGLTGWEIDPAPPSGGGTVVNDATHVHTGASAAKMTANGSGWAALRTTDIYEMQLDSLITASGWIWTAAVGSAALVVMDYYDEFGVPVLSDFVIGLTELVAGQWTSIDMTPFATDTGFVQISYWFSAAAGNTAWFDDMALTYANARVRSVSSQYGRPFNTSGIRESTTLRADLRLVARQVDHEAGIVAIEAASDETLLLDYALVDNTPQTPGTSTVRGCVNMVLDRVLGAAVGTPSTGSQGVEADALVWQPGENAWSYLQSIVGSAGLRLWCDERRFWHLDDPETYNDPGSVVLSTSTLGQLVDTIDRGGQWADAAVVTYRWADGAGVTQVRRDYSNPTGSKSVAVTIERPFPGYGLAAAIVRKLRARKRVLQLGGVSDYSARPFRAALVDLPGVGQQAGVVTGVQWSQPGDRMIVETRDIISIGPNAYLYTPSGVSYNDVPVGTSYDEYVFEG